MTTMYRLAAAFGTSLTEAHLTPEILEFLSDVLKFTRDVDATQETAPQTHVDQDRDLSQIESCLDGRFSCNSAKDGPPVHQWGIISDVQQRPIQSDEWTEGKVRETHRRSIKTTRNGWKLTGFYRHQCKAKTRNGFNHPRRTNPKGNPSRLPGKGETAAGKDPAEAFRRRGLGR